MFNKIIFYTFFFLGWIHNYKAVPLSFDWLVDCITCYEFVPFKIEYQLFPMERNYVISEEMDESLFEFSKES